MIRYTLRSRNRSQPDLKVESDSVPRVGETIALLDTLLGTALVVIEVCHTIEPDDGSNRGVALTDIVVLCEEG